MELPSALRSGWLAGMTARGSFRRRLAWPLVLGGVAAACGSSSDLGGTGTQAAGGLTQANTGGAGARTGGRATGGTSTSGGTKATGGYPNTGGFRNTGGYPYTGGFRNTGGFPYTGGFRNTGGYPNTGGFGNTGGYPYTGGTCSTGYERCPCYGNNTCNAGLTCASGLCVNLPGTGGANTGGAATGGVLAGTGGTASGGKATGGVATGGVSTGGSAPGGASSTCIGSLVSSLPAVGTVCSTPGESRCDPSGNRCVCERGVWYCNNICASTYPTEPTPYSACVRGAVCDYPSGVSCECINLSWVCIGPSGCPAAIPTTGDACNGLAGVWCDYPNSSPALHMACLCWSDADASTDASWTCIQSASCPATQPPYDPSSTCPGMALCSYDSTRCSCPVVGDPWVCGIGVFLSPLLHQTPAS